MYISTPNQTRYLGGPIPSWTIGQNGPDEDVAEKLEMLRYMAGLSAKWAAWNAKMVRLRAEHAQEMLDRGSMDPDAAARIIQLAALAEEAAGEAEAAKQTALQSSDLETARVAKEVGHLAYQKASRADLDSLDVYIMDWEKLDWKDPVEVEKFKESLKPSEPPAAPAAPPTGIFSTWRAADWLIAATAVGAVVGVGLIVNGLRQ